MAQASAHRLRETLRDSKQRNTVVSDDEPHHVHVENDIKLTPDLTECDFPDTPQESATFLSGSKAPAASPNRSSVVQLARRHSSITLLANARNESNLQSIMEFVSKLSVASASEPKMSLEAVLDSLGYAKETVDSSDDEDSSSDTKSFSSGSPLAFNFGSSSDLGSASSFNPLKSLTSVLGRFSSELAHRCWIENNPHLLSREQQEARASGWKPKKAEAAELAKVMVPWRGEAAILFIDLSGYSTISAALTNSGGAHALSSAVNLYFESLLAIVATQFQGCPGFFAGDAVCCFWPCSAVRKPIEVCAAACACALELQRRAGSSKVEGTDMTFGIHCSVSFGDIESIVFSTIANENNQQAYHFVSGFPLVQTAILLGAAKVGQCCISPEAQAFVKNFARSNKIALDDPHVKEGYLLEGLDDEFQDILDNQVTDLRTQRSSWLDKALVPVTVASKLRQGFKAAHIAEMRFLCVLFVRKNVDAVSPEAWFYEVHQILDECRCPIVQILHDDKGTHLIAAVGLHHTEKSPATTGLLAARKLWERDTGSVVGVACGDVFCGITGSDVGARFDITGNACIRAARLMQQGVEKNLPVVVDASVAAFSEDDSQLEARGTVHLKGSPIPTRYFTLVKETVSVTAGISSMKWSSETLHFEERTKLAEQLISHKYQRGLALVSGPVGAGKKTLITLLCGLLNVNSITHYATRDKTPLGIMSTLADWFAHHLDADLAHLGAQCREYYNSGKITQTLNMAHQAINRFIEKDLVLVFVVSYVHLLDRASNDFIRSVISSKPTQGRGRFLFIVTAYRLWGYPAPKEIEQEMARPLKENDRMKKFLSAEQAAMVQTDIISVHIPYATEPAVFADSFRGTSYWQLRDHSAEVLAEATGGCLMLIDPIMDTCRAQYLEQFLSDSKGGDLERDKTFLVPMIDGTLELSEAGVDFFQMEIDWKRVAPRATARLLELYDALPPRLQLVLRVVASLASTMGNTVLPGLCYIMGKLNSKFSHERVRRDVDLLIDAGILVIPKNSDGDEVFFAVPAMIDCVVALLTPEQNKILKRHAMVQVMKFYDGERLDEHGNRMKASEVIPKTFYPIFVSFLARLTRAAGDKTMYARLVKDSWERMLKASTPGCIAEYEEALKHRTGDEEEPLHDPREIRHRLEERFCIENRRFPSFCYPELFSAFSEEPSLSRMKSKAQIELEKTPVLSNEFLFVVDFYPPMALGPIGGELQFICWNIANQGLDFTRGAREFITPQLRTLMAVDLDLLFKEWEHAERISPPITPEQRATVKPLDSQIRFTPRPGTDATFDSFVPPANLAEERKFIEKILAKPDTYEHARENIRLFRAYYFKVVLPRRDRAVFHQRAILGADSIVCPVMRSKRDAIRKAYNRLMVDKIDPIDVHHALMDLATGGFKSLYFNINLEMIRDEVLRTHRSTCEDFKAYLAYVVAIGAEITPRHQFMQVSGHLTP